MPIDPEEIKIEGTKYKQRAHEAQKYIEEQHALDKENAVGNLGVNAVKKGASMSGKVTDIAKKCGTIPAA